MSLHFAIKDPSHLGEVNQNSVYSRMIRKIVVHSGYDMEGRHIYMMF